MTTHSASHDDPGARRGRPTPSLLRQLSAIERAGGDGTLRFPDGRELTVSSLDKPYFPEPGLTKGDLMRYYARVAPALLPETEGRPLALKRYPNGVNGPSFFQHDPGRAPPAGTRVARVPTEHGNDEPRYVGGDLLTLLETVQLGTIAVNSWHSRLESIDFPDYAVLDLDPGPKTPFSRVVDVARWVRSELEACALRFALKTSGSRGLHILVPLPPRTSYDVSAALAERLAVRVAEAHPREATVERSLDARTPGQVYVDHMQNARGKTLASVFAVRARAGATVSTPLSWRQLVRADFDPAAFTLESVPGRLAALTKRWRTDLGATNEMGDVQKAAGRGGRQV